jgi:putative addiction module killer protein
LYFVNKNGRIIILLYGGGKSTQKTDIEKAKKIAEELENDKNEKI